MAGSFTSVAQGMVLDWLFQPGASPTRPTAFYLSLHTGANGGAGANNEISTTGTGYARQLTTFTRVGNLISNTSAIGFGPATSAWGTVTDCCVWTAATGGVCLAQGTDSASVTYATNDTATIAPGAQTLTLT